MHPGNLLWQSFDTWLSKAFQGRRWPVLGGPTMCRQSIFLNDTVFVSSILFVFDAPVVGYDTFVIYKNSGFQTKIFPIGAASLLRLDAEVAYCPIGHLCGKPLAPSTRVAWHKAGRLARCQYFPRRFLVACWTHTHIYIFLYFLSTPCWNLADKSVGCCCCCCSCCCCCCSCCCWCWCSCSCSCFWLCWLLVVLLVVVCSFCFVTLGLQNISSSGCSHVRLSLCVRRYHPFTQFLLWHLEDIGQRSFKRGLRVWWDLAEITWSINSTPDTNLSCNRINFKANRPSSISSFLVQGQERSTMFFQCQVLKEMRSFWKSSCGDEQGQRMQKVQVAWPGFYFWKSLPLRQLISSLLVVLLFSHCHFMDVLCLKRNKSDF